MASVTLLSDEALPDSEAQLQTPSVEVVRDCNRDLIIARFERKREGAILE
jgi:hypothetical protein